MTEYNWLVNLPDCSSIVNGFYHNYLLEDGGMPLVILAMVMWGAILFWVAVRDPNF